jgi:AraC-like DNA-binding protein
MSVEVTAGRLPTQASATSAEPTPISAATRATASMTTQSRSVGPSPRAGSRTWPAPSAGSAVGFAVGYDSPSQFSREYRRMFGVPPSRDALALPR